MSIENAARAAFALGILRAAGAAGDMWIQTDTCARIKGAHDDEPIVDKDPVTDEVTATHYSHEGRLACAEHVATYVLTQGVALVAANKVLGAGLKPKRIAAALAVSAVTHYIGDRRRPLKKLAHATGKGAFYDRLTPICGSFELDQAYHHLCEAIAAVLAGRD